jgi:hypothetical protein
MDPGAFVRLENAALELINDKKLMILGCNQGGKAQPLFT